MPKTGEPLLSGSLKKS